MLQRPAIAVNSASSLYVRARGIDGVEIWRMESERSVVIATIPMDQSVIGIAWFSEFQVALFGKNGQFKVYDIIENEGEIRVDFVEGSKIDLGVTLKSFVASGRKIVFGDDTGSVWLAEFDKSWLLAKSHGHENSVDALVFSPDRSRVASAGRDKTIKIWSSDIPNNTTLEATHSQVLDFFSIAYDSSDDSEVVSTAQESEVEEDLPPPLSSDDVLDFFSVAEDDASEGKGELGEQDTMADASPFALTTTESPEMVNLQCLAVLEGGSGWAIALEFSADSKRLVSGAMDNKVYLWDIDGETLINSQETHEGWVSSVAFSPGDKIIASGSWDKNICLFDGQTLELLETMKFHRDYVVDVEFQNDALYSASYDGLIAKWNIETYKIEEILDSDSDWIQAIRFLNDGTLISVCSDGSSVQWSLPTNEIVWQAGQVLSAGIKVGESSDIFAYMTELAPESKDDIFDASEKTERHPNPDKITVEVPRKTGEKVSLESPFEKSMGPKTEAVSESFVLSSESVGAISEPSSDASLVKVEKKSKADESPEPVEAREESEAVAEDSKLEEQSKADETPEPVAAKEESVVAEDSKLEEQSKADETPEPVAAKEESVVVEDSKLEEQSKADETPEPVEAKEESVVVEDSKLEEQSKADETPEPVEAKEESVVVEDSKLEEQSKVDEAPEPVAAKEESVVVEDSKLEEQSKADETPEPVEAKEESVVVEDSKLEEQSKADETPEPVEAKEESEAVAEDSKLEEQSKADETPEPVEAKEESVLVEDSKLEEHSRTEAISESFERSESVAVDAVDIETESRTEAFSESLERSESDNSEPGLANDRSLSDESTNNGEDQFKGNFVSGHFQLDPESSVAENSEHQIDAQSSIADGSHDFKGENNAQFDDSKTRHKGAIAEKRVEIRKVELSPLVATDIPSEVLDEMIDEIGGLDESIEDAWKAPFDEMRFGMPQISESVVSDVAPEPKTGEISDVSTALLHESSEYRTISAQDLNVNRENAPKTKEVKTAIHTLPTEKTDSERPPQVDHLANFSTPTIDFEESDSLVEATAPAPPSGTSESTKQVHSVPKIPAPKVRVPNEPVVPQGFQSTEMKIEEVSPAEIYIQRRRSSSFGMGIVQKQEPIPTRFEKYVTIRTPHESVYGIALSQDGTRIASCGDSHLCIWSSNGELIHKLEAPTAGLNAIMFGYDERIVTAAGDDGNIHLWFLPDEKQQLIQHAILKANQVWVTNIDISADMKTLISAGYDGTARIWDLSTGECIRTLSGHTGPVTGITLGPRTYSCGADGTIRVWNDVWKLVDQHHGFDKLTGIATHGTNICVTAANGDVFALRSGRLIPLLRHRGEARTAKMRSDGVSASAGEDGLVMFYQPDFETPYAVIKLATPIWDMAFNHDFCVIAGDDGRIYLHRAK